MLNQDSVMSVSQEQVDESSMDELQPRPGSQSGSIPAHRQEESISYSLTGGPGVRHWREATTTEPGTPA